MCLKVMTVHTGQLCISQCTFVHEISDHLAFDPAPVKLRPLLKKPLVLVGFFRREGLTAGAGMWDGFAKAVTRASPAVESSEP